MALVVKDRVKQTTTTSGTGSIVLNGAVDGFQTFTTALTDGDTTYYAIVEPSTNSWEVGLGTWNEGTTTLARTTVLASSNSNNAISLSGQAEVFITQPASKATYLNADGDLSITNDLSVGGTLTVTGATTLQDSVTVQGNLTVQGTTTTVEATNLAIADNMIYLNDGSTVSNPDLGWAGNYNDGTYAHAGVFRDASDGTFKFFDSYTPEPDASTNIDTAHASFTLAKVATGNLAVTGNITVSSTVDGRDIAADGTKLDGIEAGATADQTASEILTAIKTVDGAASGLDADLLDGQHGSYYLDWTHVTNKPDPTVTLSGDVSGSATMTDLGSITITTTVANDSHTHDGRYYTETEVGNFFGGTTAITGYNKTNWDTAYGWGNHASAGYLLSSSYTAADVLTKIKTVDGAASGLDADLLDGQDSSYYLDWTNTTNKPDPVITLTGAVTGSGTMTDLGSVSITTTATSDPTLTLAGDATGSATFTNLGNATLTVTVVDDSHNHIISNVDGLQTALDGKLSTSGKAADSNLLDGLDSSQFLRSDTTDSATGLVTFSNLRFADGINTDYNDYDALAAILHRKESATAFRPVTNIEYWNGSAWVATSALNSIIPTLLTGDSQNEGNIPNTYKRFRFTITLSSTYLGGFWVVSERHWSGGGDISRTYDMKIELGNSDMSTIAATSSFTVGADIYGYNKLLSWHYNYQYMRVEYDFSNYTGDIPLVRFDAYNVYGRGSGNLTDNTPFNWNSTILNTPIPTLRLNGNTVWHVGNDGSGSGLDADLLDGQHGSYYLDWTNATNKPDPVLTLAGDATGSATFTDLGNATLTVTVVDDSHNHIISNVDGLQTALDAKLASSSYTASDVLSKILTVDGSGSGLDADLWDGNQFSTYLDQAVLTTSSPTFANVYVGDYVYHTGDTDTYTQFHAADQWRVVTGGTERFEINNSDVTVQSALKEKYVALSGTTPSIDVDAGGAFSLTTSGNTTFTFTAFTSGISGGFILQLTSGGSHTITWPASVDWAGGTAPDAPASGETDIYVFWSRDGGTTWYGVQSIDAAA